jgi:hypothetical protein
MNMRYKLFVAALIFITLPRTVTAQHHNDGDRPSWRKDPAIGALLSLQPLPVDLGSFYAGNWERGIIYTVAEVALFVPAIVLISENAGWWGHHRYDSFYYNDPTRRRTWTRAERERFYYLLGAYVLVKVVSAFDAGYSVERRNTKLAISYDENISSVGLSIVVPLSFLSLERK